MLSDNLKRDSKIEQSANENHCEPIGISPDELQIAKMAQFGEKVWKLFANMNPEVREEIMEIASELGMVNKVRYDPNIHGELIEAEFGQYIWWWI